MIDIPQPEPREGEVLVRTLRVGIDGTDHEVITGSHGGFPEDEDYQILGHEAVGVVADANGTELEEGQLVVPTVRRPPDGQSNEYFARGEPDMAPAGAYLELRIQAERVCLRREQRLVSKRITATSMSKRMTATSISRA